MSSTTPDADLFVTEVGIFPKLDNDQYGEIYDENDVTAAFQQAKQPADPGAQAGDAPADVAWKLLAVNLSDLAAKGARPVGALLGYTLGEEAWQLVWTHHHLVLEESHWPDHHVRPDSHIVSNPARRKKFRRARDFRRAIRTRQDYRRRGADVACARASAGGR